MALILHAGTTAAGNGAEFFSTQRDLVTTATIACWGNFGAGTLTFRMSPDAGTTWLDFPAAITFTAAGTKQVVVPQGVKIRGEFTIGVAASLFCTVYGAD